LTVRLHTSPGVLKQKIFIFAATVTLRSTTTNVLTWEIIKGQTLKRKLTKIPSTYCSPSSLCRELLITICIIIWQAFVLPDESRNLICCWRGRIFPHCPRAIRNLYCPTKLRRKASFKRQKLSKRATAVVKELSQYVSVSESRNYKVNINFTMCVAIKAVQNSCVLTM
jgi:hypothetical protein